MRELLTKLSLGLNKDELGEKDLDLINQLFHAQYIKYHKNTYKLKDNYRFGIVDISRMGVGFLETFSAKKFKKDLKINALNDAQKGDIVVAKIEYKANKPHVKILEILFHKNSHTLVYTHLQAGKIIGINLQTLMPTTLNASQKSLKIMPLQSVLKINNQTSQIQEVLGVLSDPKIDEKISLAIYNKHEIFPSACENEAKAYPDQIYPEYYPDYEDLSDLAFCTIDPSDAKDFDDSICFIPHLRTLYVAIADVTSYVHAFSSLDKEAKLRGFSIYFPHKSIPMLPRYLSENICSLKPNENRLAFGFKFIFDENLNIKEEKLGKFIICSKQRFNYDQIDEFLQHKGKLHAPKEVSSYILPLFELTKKLRKKRLQKACDFQSDELSLILDDEENLIKTCVNIESDSHKLVEECMLLANKAAAKLIKIGVFRNHLAPSFERIEELINDLNLIGITCKQADTLWELFKDIQAKADNLGLRVEVDKLVIKAQKQAKYEATSLGHFGLGFDNYTHFTSPIRRYSDLILHRLLKAQLSNDQKLINYQLSDIQNTCENISLLERESDKVAWDFCDRKFARWAKEHVNEDFEAIITQNERLSAAKITNSQIQGARVLLVEEGLFLLQKIIVRIIDANIAQGQIYAKIVKYL